MPLRPAVGSTPLYPVIVKAFCTRAEHPQRLAAILEGVRRAVMLSMRRNEPSST